MGILRSSRVRVAGFACAGALILLSGACSENAGQTERQTPVEGQTTESGAVLSVSAREYAFVPDRLQVRPGQVAELRLKNDGSKEHSLSVYEDDGYSEPVEGATVATAAPGETEAVSLNPPGGSNELYFRCEIHHEMTGTIEIGPDAAARR